MFHLIWAIIFIIKLYKSVANAPKKKKFTTKYRSICFCYEFTTQIIIFLAER